MAVLNLMLANHPAIQKFAEFPNLLAETNWNDWGHFMSPVPVGGTSTNSTRSRMNPRASGRRR